MINFNFDVIPKLTLNKYLSFNKPEENMKSEETEKDFKSQFSGKHL